jgi:hypothetical protein
MASGKPNPSSKDRAVMLPTPGVRLKRSQALRFSRVETICCPSHRSDGWGADFGYDLGLGQGFFKLAKIEVLLNKSPWHF